MPNEIVTTVKEVIQRTHNVKSVRVDDKGVIEFKPGQFIYVSLEDNKEMSRYLSISSSPTQKGYIEFTKKITESGFSKRIDALKPGDSVKIKYAMGNFIFHGEYAKIAFLSGGIGITPIMSILAYIRDKKLDTDAVLLYGNSSLKDIAFRKELDEIGGACEKVRIVNVVCVDEEKCGMRTGYITEEVISEEIPDYADRKFYICGPPGMVQSMTKILNGLKVPDENIILENFKGY